ncbi:RICIN domain-containing protein [Streptodolium elevatio]
MNGNKIQLHTCNGTAAQKWRIDSANRIVNAGTGKVLDVAGSKTTNGTAVQLWAPHTKANQKWTVRAQ